jgi:hypothetical protein
MNTTSLAAAAALDRRGPWLAWPQIVLLLALFALVRAPALVGTPDTFWHLTAGQWIVEHLQVPDRDPFSHSMAGAPWHAHEWLSEVVMWTTWRAMGWGGLALLAVLCWGTALAIMTRFVVARLEPAHALLLVGLAAGMAMTHLSARPQALTLPILVLWVSTLVTASERRASPPWWLVPVMVLWANLHGSYTLGLALSAALAGDAVAAAASGERRRAAGRWGLFVAACLAASMLTPFGWEGLRYTYDVMQQKLALATIQEWQSPNFHKPHPLEFWLLVFFGLAMAGRVRLPWVRIVIILGLTHLALKHMRNVAILGWVAPLVMAAPLARSWYTDRRPGRDAERIDRFFRSLAAPSPAAGWLVCAMVVVGVLATLVQRDLVRPSPKWMPVAAVAAAEKDGLLATLVFNAYNFGGYLILRGIPVYIDGRSDMYGDPFLRDTLTVTMPRDAAAIQAHLDRYRIGWTLLSPEAPTVVLLDQMPGWRRVHADDVAVVHARTPAGAAATRP